MSGADTSVGAVIGGVVSFVCMVARDRYREHEKLVKDTRNKLTRVIDCLQAPHTITDWHNELDVGAGQMISQAICLGVAPELIELMQALRKALGQCRRCDSPVKATCESCPIARWAMEDGCYVQAYYEKLTPRIRVWRIKSPLLWIEKYLLRKTIDEMRHELDGLGRSGSLVVHSGT